MHIHRSFLYTKWGKGVELFWSYKAWKKHFHRKNIQICHFDYQSKRTQMFHLRNSLNNFCHICLHGLSQESVKDEGRQWKNVTVQIKWAKHLIKKITSWNNNMVAVETRAGRHTSHILFLKAVKNKSTYSLMAAAAPVWQQRDATMTLFSISPATTRLDFQDGIIPPWNIEHFESMNKIPLILLF